MKISLVYISLSGNTASFIKRLSTFLQERHENVEIEQVDIKDMVKEERPFYAMSQPFVAFLPTYLEGGNGLDNGDVEILTNDLGDFIAFEENYKRCLFPSRETISLTLTLMDELPIESLWRVRIYNTLLISKRNIDVIYQVTNSYM